MNKIFTVILAGAAIVGFAGTASAAPWVIDFDNGVDTNGDPTTFAGNTIFGNGSGYQRYDGIGDGGIPGADATVRIRAFDRYWNSRKAVGYDTTQTDGEDPDLQENFNSPFGNDLDGNPVQNSGYGNVLIVQEGSCGSTSGGVCRDADDERYGGWLKFEFDQTVRLLGMNVLDNEERYGKVYFNYGQDDQVVLDLPTMTNHDVTFMTFNGSEGILANTMKVKFKGSGAIDNITGDTPGNEVSEPASLALFGIGLAAMGVYRRRRKA